MGLRLVLVFYEREIERRGEGRIGKREERRKGKMKIWMWVRWIVCRVFLKEERGNKIKVF